MSDGSVDASEERLARGRVSSRPSHPLRPEPRQGVRGQDRRARRARPLDLVRRRGPRSRPVRRSPTSSRLAERESLDFVIGSKRHPDSLVHYPPSRRVGSWLYQQFVRLLFSLDVRDTQVGLKVFRREVAEEVLPLLLVKQFAFDLEFLAVARALGYRRIREQPVTLEYRFTGSGVRSRGRAARAGRHGGDLLPAPDPSLLPAQAPAAARVCPDAGLPAARHARRTGRAEPQLEYPDARRASRVDADTPESAASAPCAEADGDVVAFLERGRDAGARTGWRASIPFLANHEIAAVVTPSMTPAQGSLRERAAAALRSRGSAAARTTSGSRRATSASSGSSPAGTSSPAEPTCSELAEARSPPAPPLRRARRPRPHRPLHARDASSSPRAAAVSSAPRSRSPHAAVRAGEAIRERGLRGAQRRRRSRRSCCSRSSSAAGRCVLLGGVWRLAWASSGRRTSRSSS